MRLHAILSLVVLAAVGCRDDPDDAAREIPVHVSTVALDAGNVPVVILEEDAGPRLLPIWIGSAEATSIAAEMHKQRPARPNSHDFAARLIEGLEGELLRVVVTEIRDGTFYALLVLRVHGKLVEIDARPSDAIATALRAGAPILVREEVFEAAGEAQGSSEHKQSVGWPPATGSPPATRAVAV
jgi:bifunctional DNase/RNase